MQGGWVGGVSWGPYLSFHVVFSTFNKLSGFLLDAPAIVLPFSRIHCPDGRKRLMLRPLGLIIGLTSQINCLRAAEGVCACVRARPYLPLEDDGLGQ